MFVNHHDQLQWAIITKKWNFQKESKIKSKMYLGIAHAQNITLRPTLCLLYGTLTDAKNIVETGNARVGNFFKKDI